MKNYIFIFIVCAICFGAGYGLAILIYLGDKVDDQVAILNQFAEEESRDRPVTIEIIREVPVYRDPYSDEQKDILGSIRNRFINEATELIVDGIPMTDLISLVSRLSGYKEDDLWRMQQPHNFAKNLVSLGMGECVAEVEDDIDSLDDSSGLDSQVLFSLRASEEPNSPQDSVSQGDKVAPGVVPGIVYGQRFRQSNASRIYANFKLPDDYEYNDILVKWCQNSPNQKNIVFGPHSISRTHALNYVWYETTTPEIGDYFVHIYTSAEQPQLIASSSYSIVNDDP